MARSYTVPRWGASNDTLAGFLRECVSEGASWLATQKPASEFENLIERLGPVNAQLNLAGQSNITYPKTERLAREIVASLTSFSHVGEYKPTASQSLYSQAGVLTQLDHSWFHEESVYAAHRTMAQLAVTLGTAYGWQTWDPHFHGAFKGDIRLQALSPDKVTFVQLPGDHDLQRAYITLIREELPITLAKRIYARTNAAFANSLLPDRDAPGWISRGLKKVQQFLSPALRVRGMRPGDFDQDTAFPVVDIFHAYINDDTLNESGAPMTMGSEGTNWSYSVPTLGGPFPTGLVNPATGAMLTRSADPNEAQLFPLKRYIIFARSTDIVAYDNSSPWWHGQTPLVRLRFNDWPWEALGRSTVAMISSMEDSANAIMQGMEDSIAARLDPPMLYNDQAVTKGFAEAFNPRKAGSKAEADLTQGDVIKFPIPVQTYDLPSYIPEYLKYLDDRMEYLTGARDLTAMAKAKQVPSSDSIEKFLEMAGPLVQDMVRAIILPYQQLGEMRKSDYFQFYTYERLLQTVDDAGEESDWLYKPELLVGRLDTDTVQSRNDRAKGFLSAFKYRVSQSGVTEINRMTTKLFYLQLQKIGFPIDWWTIAKVAQLPQFGAVPFKLDEDGQPSEEQCHSILEKWMAQVRMQHEMAEKYAGQQGGGQPPAKGRPNSNQKPPHIQSKSGGTRSTVSTS